MSKKSVMWNCRGVLSCVGCMCIAVFLFSGGRVCELMKLNNARQDKMAHVARATVGEVVRLPVSMEQTLLIIKYKMG